MEAEPQEAEDAWPLTPRELEARRNWASGPDGALRREAQAPNTTGARLEAIAHEMLRRPMDFHQRESSYWVMEAVFAHPNVSPRLVHSRFFHHAFTDAMARAFFANPIAPLTLLELPDFALSLPPAVQNRLLKQETMPPSLVRQIADAPAATPDALDAAEAARLHVTIAGEAASSQWERELRDYWKTYCLRADERARQWHADLAELGLAPAWAMGAKPPPLLKSARKKVLQEWFLYRHAPSSPDARALLQRIAPYLPPEWIAHKLRAGATEADLRELLNAADHKRGLVGRAIFHHPAVSADLIRSLAQADEGRFRREAICHPRTPPDVIKAFARNALPAVRRTARVHPNAPSDTTNVSRAAALKFANGGTGSAFVGFVQCLHRVGRDTMIPWQADADAWTTRLATVLLASPDTLDAPLPVDSEGRTGRFLLNRLARDGNRIVRAAARAKLADSAYRFVL